MFTAVIILALNFSGISLASQQKNIITVGYSAHSDNFISDLKSQTHKGYGYDIFKKIEDVSNLEFEFVPINGDLVRAVERNVVDIAGFTVKTDDKENQVHFSQIPFGKTFSVLGTKDHNQSYNTPQDIDGKTVALFQDSIGRPFLERYLDFYDISVNYLYGSESYYMNLKADYYLTYTQDNNSEYLNNVLNLGVYSLYLISSFENEDILNTLDTIFFDVISTEGNYFLELEEKYLSQYIELNHRSLNPSEIETLKQKPLEVGYIADYAPISYTDENGEAAGSLVEIMNLFVDEYDFEIDYIPYSLLDDKSAHENFDIMLTIYGDGIHDHQHYDITEAFFNLPMYSQIHSDIYEQYSDTQNIFDNLDKIGVLPYDFLGSGEFENRFPRSEMVVYHDWHTLLDDFAQKKLDSIITTASASTYAEIYLSDVERVTVPTNLTIPLHFFIAKDISEQYIPIFNIMSDNFPEETYQNIINNNSIEFYPQATFLDHIRQNIAVYFAIIIILVFLIVSLILKQQQKKREMISKAYNTDKLTGLMSMNRFGEVLFETINNCKPREYELISFDVDMFKTINTHYSDERGTALIVAISKALNKAFDGSSAYVTRRIADQFLILRKVGSGKDIEEIYKNYIFPNAKKVIQNKSKIVMSFGHIIIEDNSENASTVMGQADSARRLGKGKHDTTFITFDDSMRKQYKNNIDFTFRMEKALKDGEFKAVFQPKINFKTLKVDGAEALVRWIPTNGDRIYPNEFIPVFEENGFISALDMCVLEQVCVFIKQNLEQAPRISVNLSGYTVLSENLVQTISDITTKHQVPHEKLEFEITESAMVGNEKEFLEVTKQLRSLGYLVSIDDFGAGVSSLNRLAIIEANILKLDKAFFDIDYNSSNSKVIVQDVISMAKHLNMSVVAEGVETKKQAMWLKEINCDYAQGFYFERPLDKDTFKKLLENDKAYEL